MRTLAPAFIDGLLLYLPDEELARSVVRFDVLTEAMLAIAGEETGTTYSSYRFDDRFKARLQQLDAITTTTAQVLDALVGSSIKRVNRNCTVASPRSIEIGFGLAISAGTYDYEGGAVDAKLVTDTIGILAQATSELINTGALTRRQTVVSSAYHQALSFAI